MKLTKQMKGSQRLHQYTENMTKMIIRQDCQNNLNYLRLI